MTALLLATFVSLQAAQARPATPAAFQPRLTVKSQPPRPLVFPAPLDAARRRALATEAPGVRGADDREIICGTVVVRKSPEADAKIVLPSRETGAVIRRIEPQACTSRTKDQGK